MAVACSASAAVPEVVAGEAWLLTSGAYAIVAVVVVDRDLSRQVGVGVVAQLAVLVGGIVGDDASPLCGWLCASLTAAATTAGYGLFAKDLANEVLLLVARARGHSGEFGAPEWCCGRARENLVRGAPRVP